MIRNLKAFGVVLAAMLATSALVASAAHATTAQFGFQTGTVKVKAENDPSDASHIQNFSSTAGSYACNSIAAEAAVFNGEEITGINVNYWDTSKGTKAEHKCLGPLGVVTTVESSSCHFLLTPGEEVKAGESLGSVDLVSTGAEPCITVKNIGCTVSIPEQIGINGVTYKTIKTESGLEHITVKVAATNIKSSHTGPTCGTGEDKASKYNGTATLTGHAIGEGSHSVAIGEAEAPTPPTAQFGFQTGTVKVKAENDPSDASHIQNFSSTAGSYACNSIAAEAAVFNGEEITGINVNYWDTSKGTKAEHKCLGPLGVVTTVESSSCHFLLTPGEEVKAGESLGSVDLVSTGAEPCITVKNIGCTVSIPEQIGINGVTYKTIKTESGLEHITVKVAATNIKSSHTGPTCGTGEDKASKYNGTATLTGHAIGEGSHSVTVE